MSRPRFTIARLLGVVALVGVAFAALRQPTDAWGATLLGLTLLVLLTSVLLAMHRSGGRRAYWRGFALFGWAYLVADSRRNRVSTRKTSPAMIPAPSPFGWKVSAKCPAPSFPQVPTSGTRLARQYSPSRALVSAHRRGLRTPSAHESHGWRVTRNTLK